MTFDLVQPIILALASSFLAVGARTVALAFSFLVSLSENRVNNSSYMLGL